MIKVILNFVKRAKYKFSGRFLITIICTISLTITSCAYNDGQDVFEDKGNCDQIIAECNKTLEINPKSFEAYYYRGTAYNHKGQHDEAIADYNKALEINPKAFEAYHNRGIAYGLKKQYDEAIADYNKALEINPKCADVYYNRALAYCYKGEYERARNDFDKAQTLGYNMSRAVREFFLEVARRGAVQSHNE